MLYRYIFNSVVINSSLRVFSEHSPATQFILSLAFVHPVPKFINRLCVNIHICYYYVLLGINNKQAVLVFLSRIIVIIIIMNVTWLVFIIFSYV